MLTPSLWKIHPFFYYLLKLNIHSLIQVWEYFNDLIHNLPLKSSKLKPFTLDTLKNGMHLKLDGVTMLGSKHFPTQLHQ